MITTHHPSTAGTVLITLLIVVVVALVITSAGTSLIITNFQNTSQYQQGVSALKLAESGLENAVLRILRNPDYTGEALTIDGNPVMIVVTGENPKQVTVEASVNSYSRRIQAQVELDPAEGVWSVTSWKESY